MGLGTLFKKAISSFSRNNVRTVEYDKGVKGTKDSKLDDYSKQMQRYKASEDKGIVINYGDELGRRHMTRIGNQSYIDRIEDEEKKGNRVVSVGDDGEIRRLKVGGLERIPEGQLVKAIRDGSRRYNVVETDKTDDYGHRISHVVGEERRDTENYERISQKSVLQRYMEQIVQGDGDRENFGEKRVGRALLEHIVAHLRNVKNNSRIESLDTIHGEKAEAYTLARDDGRVEVYNRKVADYILSAANYYLDLMNGSKTFQKDIIVKEASELHASKWDMLLNDSKYARKN